MLALLVPGVHMGGGDGAGASDQAQPGQYMMLRGFGSWFLALIVAQEATGEVELAGAQPGSPRSPRSVLVLAAVGGALGGVAFKLVEGLL